ncbi:hypothetical protein E3N88_29767 [Mikania micrantha]|uniref:Translation elongation factor P/YeiP central domain-containing protein n=1 Tax=Mikania micrantha TaxID=192012 RepID=A0A5N6MMM4_9ASTR|nr:hypothetical protein E3N88_29767 [Mikania micrantha]
MALPFPPLPFSPRTFTFRLSRAKSRKLLPIDPPATASQPPDVLHSLRHYHQPPDVLRPSSSRRTTLQPSAAPADPVTASPRKCQPPRHLLSVPWSANQIRFAKARGSDVSSFALYAYVLNMMLDQETSLSEKVVKAQQSTQGRGGAIIQVELRDVDSGNKVNERFRTDETIEKIFVEAKSYTYLYTDEEIETVVLMGPNTFIQLDVPKHLFGNSLAYLKADELTLLIYYEKSMSLDDITVSVELFNDRPMSASVPKRVICTVVEAQVPMKAAKSDSGEHYIYQRIPYVILDDTPSSGTSLESDPSVASS